MNGAPLLDTHAWVSWMERDGRFDSHTFGSLDTFPPEERPYLCDISLWEVAMAVDLKRLALKLPLEEMAVRGFTSANSSTRFDLARHRRGYRRAPEHLSP